MEKRKYTILKTDKNISLVIDLNSDTNNIGIYDYLDSDIITENTFINFQSFIDNGTIKFINRSDNELNNLLWSFGDGSISNDIDPVHTYSDLTKDYIVRLSYFDNETEFFIEKLISFNKSTPIRGNSQELSNSTLLDDYFVDVNNIVSGTTLSNISELISYKEPNLFIGKIKNNKKIINIIDDNVIYLDNFSSEKPITYIDNSVNSLFSFIPENIDKNNIKLEQIIKSPSEFDQVENLKVVNNLTQSTLSDDISTLNSVLYGASTLLNLKSSKIAIKNL